MHCKVWREYDVAVVFLFPDEEPITTNSNKD